MIYDNQFSFHIRDMTGCSTAKKAGEFLLVSSLGIQLRTILYNQITLYMILLLFFFFFFLLLIELY